MVIRKLSIEEPFIRILQRDFEEWEILRMFYRYLTFQRFEFTIQVTKASTTLNEPHTRFMYGVEDEQIWYL